MPDAPVRRSTTRGTLRRLLAALLVTTAAAGVATVWTFSRARETADTVRNQTAPAILQLTAVRDALVGGDTVVITTFHAERDVTSPRLAGPGDEFRNQIAIASQGLTQVAAADVSGADSRALQLIQALLVTYTGMVEQASAYWQRDDKALGTAELWNASRLLHGSGGILQLVDSLLAARRDALAGQARAAWMTWPATVAVTMLNLALCALLGIAFVALRRRFRRVLSIGLATAAVLLFYSFVVIYQIHDTQQRVTDSRAALDRLTDDQIARTSTVQSQSQRTLADLIGQSCGARGCGDTAAQFVAKARSVKPGRDVAEAQLTTEEKRVAEQVHATDAGGLPRPLVYPLHLGVGLSILAGFWPRLQEYRYRST